jgi:hypothetical protein
MIPMIRTSTAVKGESMMRTGSIFCGLAVAGLVAFVVSASAAEDKEQHVAMDRLPPRVKATLEKERAGGTIDEVEKETEGSKTFYEAEIVKNGHESYIHVSEDGKVLKRETEADERKAEGVETEEHGERHHK